MTQSNEIEALGPRSVIERYFAAIDARDWALLETCFVPDVEMCVTASDRHGTSGHWAHGFGEVRALMNTLAQFPASTHVLANAFVQMSDTASADSITNAIAYVVDTSAGGHERVIVRGLMYFDRIVNDGSGWRLQRRVHVPLWQYEAAAMATALRPSAHDDNSSADR